MTKKYILPLALVLASATGYSAPRTAEQAMSVAKQFVLRTPEFKQGTLQTTLSSYTAASMHRQKAFGSNAPAYYLVNVGENDGFVVVSGDDRFAPVLGYAINGHITAGTELPDGLQYWLDFLSAEMGYAMENGYADVAYASENRSDDYTASVQPLLSTKWDQTSPYNNKIPNYATGCVATGTAQVMNYWKYPTKGVGSHTNAYNTQYAADFGTTTYDWANMKDVYGGKYDTKAEVEAVSTLMYHLGVATDMRWNKPEVGSGTPNMYAGHALINFFAYNKNLYAEQRDCLSLGAWKALVISQLQTGHPLCYAGMTGVSGAAGHFFVLDGYDATTGLFHFNWGWSGNFDGYYSLTALEPGVGGVGAGTGSFNYDQQMFVNVQPTETGEYVAHFDAKEVYPVNSSSKQKVIVNTIDLSHNALNFKGGVGLEIIGKEDGVLSYLPSRNGFPSGGFNPGSTCTGSYGFEFDMSGVSNGSYEVCLATNHEDYPGKFYPIRAHYGKSTYFVMTVSDGGVSFTESKPDYQVEALAQPVICDAKVENTLYQNTISTFEVIFKNVGTTAFNDEVGVCIKKSRDSNPQYITIPCTLLPGEEKTVTLRGKVLRDPGTYNLVPCFGENGVYVAMNQSLQVTVGDEASAVRPALSAEAEIVYNMQGMRMPSATRLPKGMYIINGKKVIIDN